MNPERTCRRTVYGGARTILRIPTSSEVGLDVAAYNQARLVLHTHFVRSGYVMLPVWPATIQGARRRLQHHRPTSHEVGIFKKRETLTDS
jgi:hypothetical protein